MNLVKAMWPLDITYKSIDIRAMIIRESGSSPWTCILLKVCLSMQDLSEIQKRHMEKKTRWNPLDKDVRLILECKPIGELSALLNQIEENKLILDGNPVNFVNNHNFVLSNIQKYDGGYTQDKEFIHWFLYTNQANSKNILGVAENHGFSESKLGLNFQSIRYLFDIPENTWRSLQQMVLILLPVYIKRETINIDEQNPNHILIIYNVHNKLINKIQDTRAIVGIKNEEGFSRSLKLIQNSCSENDFVSFVLKLEVEKAIESIEINFYAKDCAEILFKDIIRSDSLYPSINLAIEDNIDKIIQDISNNNKFTERPTQYVTNKIVVKGSINDSLINVGSKNNLNYINTSQKPDLTDMFDSISKYIATLTKTVSQTCHESFNDFLDEYKKEKSDKDILKKKWTNFKNIILNAGISAGINEAIAKIEETLSQDLNGSLG